MFKLLTKVVLHNCNKVTVIKQSYRTFLSQAYYCNEVWDQRFNNPLIKKVNLDELYNELDQKFQKTRTISAVDVDVFSNAIQEESYTDELLDLLHKLRLSADTCNTFRSTWHATIRSFINFNKLPQLLDALDDRLNYGLFLDNYEANLLLDTCWKNKDYASGARVASQLMLQEDFNHLLCSAFSLLHCYNYLLNPDSWIEPPKPEEPEEEIKYRVKYLRNPFDDNHFDLRNPQKIVAKTLIEITKHNKNPADKSLHLVGLVLFEQFDKAKNLIEELVKNKDKIYGEALQLIPEDKKVDLNIKNLEIEQSSLEKILEERVKLTQQMTSEKDIALQCETYSKWEQDRADALEKQCQRLLTAQRLSNIEQSQKKLKDKEMLLWFFENEEKIELEIEEKKTSATEKVQKKEVKSKTDSDYIPPEIGKKSTISN